MLLSEQVCRVALADSAYTHPCALTILSPANFAVNVSRERSPSLRDIAGHSPLMVLSARSYRRSDDTERTFPSTEFRGHRRSRFATFTTTVLWTRLFGLTSVDQDLGGRAGRGRVLAGNQQPVDDKVDFPVLDLGEDGAESEQLVFDQERNDLSKADIRLLTVGEPRHVLSLDQRFAGGGLDVAQHAGGMADQRDWLAAGEEGLDQFDRVRIFGEVPHGAVPARIKNSIIILLLHALEPHSRVELVLCISVFLEATSNVGLEAGILALGIEGRTAALGRC